MKTMRLIASTCVALALLSGCSRDEPEDTLPVTAPENTRQVPQEQPRNDTDLPQSPNPQDPAITPTTNNPYTPTEDPYAPTDESGTETMGEGVDGVSPPADDDMQ